MAGGLSLDHPWAFAFGILGNAISFTVYLAPLPTFYRIYRKKSTEGFKSEPYVVALFSAMLWIFYALIKKDAYLLITINSFGCVIETIYTVLFLLYASKQARVHTFKMIILLNVGLSSLIVLCILLLISNGSLRLQVLGWICVAFSVSVFVAPLSVIRQVIHTKSVEFMPFNLSFFLTLSAVLPNILGFAFGAIQMLLYIIYKDTKAPKSFEVEEKSQVGKLSSVEIIVDNDDAEEVNTTMNDETERAKEADKANDLGIEKSPI